MNWFPLCQSLRPPLPRNPLTPSNLYFIKPELIPTEWNCMLLWLFLCLCTPSPFPWNRLTFTSKIGI